MCWPQDPKLDLVPECRGRAYPGVGRAGDWLAAARPCFVGSALFDSAIPGPHAPQHLNAGERGGLAGCSAKCVLCVVAGRPVIGSHIPLP